MFVLITKSTSIYVVLLTLIQATPYQKQTYDKAQEESLVKEEDSKKNKKKKKKKKDDDKPDKEDKGKGSAAETSKRQTR